MAGQTPFWTLLGDDPSYLLLRETRMTTVIDEIEKARAQVALDVERLKLFWVKYGHPALYAVVSIASAVVGHLI